MINVDKIDRGRAEGRNVWTITVSAEDTDTIGDIGTCIDEYLAHEFDEAKAEIKAVLDQLNKSTHTHMRVVPDSNDNA